MAPSVMALAGFSPVLWERSVSPAKVSREPSATHYPRVSWPPGWLISDKVGKGETVGGAY